MPRVALFCLSMICVAGLKSQLSNSVFRQGPAMPETQTGFTFEALQYLRNSEYFSNLNPGSTLFGFQALPMLHYRISEHARFSTGLFMQRDFGDGRALNQLIPVFNFGFESRNWRWNLGNIRPNIHHNLIEPLMNYENVIRQPVEGGIQGLRKTQKMNYDFWLEWRQKADDVAGKQEKIVFGHSLEQGLYSTSSFRLSLPIQAIIYHQGGQALHLNAHVATRLTGAAGIRLRNKDTSILLEGFGLLCADNSDTRSQPFQNGWAAMANLRVRPFKYHEVALSWWFGRQFVTSTGNPVFSNVNLSDVYLNRNTRQLAMLRYVYSRPIVKNKLWIDFRLEPYYDFQYRNLEFAQGLYFRYIETLNIKIPRWLGF